RLSGSSTWPRCTMAPAASRRRADASERARPTTSWPAPSSSGTRAEPIQPDAPVTKILMMVPLWNVDVSNCYHHRSYDSDCQDHVAWSSWVDGNRTVEVGSRKRP